MPRPVGMEGTSRILSLGIGFREIVLAQDLFSDAENRMRYANGGSACGWNESERGEVNAKGDNRHRENPKNSSHRLIGAITVSFSLLLFSTGYWRPVSYSSFCSCKVALCGFCRLFTNG